MQARDHASPADALTELLLQRAATEAAAEAKLAEESAAAAAAATWAQNEAATAEALAEAQTKGAALLAKIGASTNATDNDDEGSRQKSLVPVVTEKLAEPESPANEEGEEGWAATLLMLAAVLCGVMIGTTVSSVRTAVHPCAALLTTVDAARRNAAKICSERARARLLCIFPRPCQPGQF